MPQLPSGRHVGVIFQNEDNMIKNFAKLHPEINLISLGVSIAQITTIDEIRPYINVIFLREAKTTSIEEVAEGSRPVPDGLESYESGFTLADFEKMTADWSSEDKQGFKEFLESERIANYFQEVINLMPKIGTDYGKNLIGWMNDICGVPEDSHDSDNPCDDYDLLVAVCIFADMEKPEGKHPLDLWYRMNATRIYCEKWLPDLINVNLDCVESPRAMASQLREMQSLNGCPEDKREWLHQQNVVYANDLFDIFEPEVLIKLNKEAYQIVKWIALAEPTR